MLTADLSLDLPWSASYLEEGLLISLSWHHEMSHVHLSKTREAVHDALRTARQLLVWIVDKGFYLLEPMCRLNSEANWRVAIKDVGEIHIQLEQLWQSWHDG